MFQLNVMYVAESRNMRQISFRCPICDNTLRYYYTCPTHCDRCSAKLINITALVVGRKEDKLTFHMYGKTVSSNREIDFYYPWQ